MAITTNLGLMTVDEYHRLGETGALDEDARVELVDGRIVEMPPIGPRHAFNVNRLNQLFMFRLIGRIVLSIQNPVTFGPRLERQPDVTLLDPHANDPDFYKTNRATPSDVLLIVEVSDSTLQTDLVEKSKQYAEHAIADYWVADLQGDQVWVHREPTPNGYSSVTTVARGESISTLAFPDVTFTVDEILG
ncbi:MAG TPA: Uma2 family endonuclease [Chloroflexota bacterium]|nr:Uma2 family endonuclease [Chloroflexota bacterium]